ncbi:hypothetical protein F4780DRAFT_772001 [Xylariomycetidae sp. FL0641]|nr:hypothetical protein F4780DRAFT_772001 [Xylariomycetidae sp. FL0641]
MMISALQTAWDHLWLRAPSATSEPAAVQTTIQFYKPLAIHAHEKPYVCEFDVSTVENAKKTNVEFEEQAVSVQDLRSHERGFTLERNGFEIIQHRSTVSLNDFKSRQAFEAKYLEECKDLIRRRYNADRVFILGCVEEIKIRHDHRGTPRKYSGAYMPVTTAHVDQTRGALFSRMVQQMGKTDAEKAFNDRRCLIVNIWRPISDPVENYPLAYCDIETVQPEDCTPVDIVKADDYEGESLYLQYRPHHRFYYLSRQRPHEVLLMKMAESNPAFPGRTYQGVPHAAFPLPPGEPGCPAPPARESVEVRTLVIV